MQVSQHSANSLDQLGLRPAADGTYERPHEIVNDGNRELGEIALREMGGEVLKELTAPSPLKIQRRLAQAAMMLKKGEVLLEELWEAYCVGCHNASFSAYKGRYRGYGRPSLCGEEPTD
jgi:hypothetical protein